MNFNFNRLFGRLTVNAIDSLPLNNNKLVQPPHSLTTVRNNQTFVMEKPRVLITGALGQLGQGLAKMLRYCNLLKFC